MRWRCPGARSGDWTGRCLRWSGRQQQGTRACGIIRSSSWLAGDADGIAAVSLPMRNS